MRGRRRGPGQRVLPHPVRVGVVRCGFARCGLSDTNATSDAFASADDAYTYTWANAGTYAATNYSSDAESLNTPDTDADAAPDDTGTDAAPDDTGTDAWTYS